MPTACRPGDDCITTVTPNIFNVITAVPPPRPPRHITTCVSSHAPNKKRHIAAGFTVRYRTVGPQIWKLFLVTLLAVSSRFLEKYLWTPDSFIH